MLGKQGVLALLADSTNVERPGYTMSERTVGRTFNRLFQGCKQRIIVTTFASNVHRIQQIMDAAAECGRKVAVTGRSMENVTKVAMDLGYMKPPKNTVVDINKIKSMPLEKQVIVTTGSQGEEMSALYRMAFSQHKQIEVGPGDRVIISASAIPGNENTVSRVINELFRKGVEVIYDRADMLHVSGHACQEELKIIHALTKPKYFIPVHGEQRMLQLHKDLALQMGMDRKNIVICDNGDAVEIGARSMKCVPGYAPAGEVFVDGYGVGDVGAVVLRDRKHLAEDGMVVVVLPISAQNGDLLAEPEIITRGFIYVKDSEELLQDLRNLTMSTAEAYRGKRGRDLNELKGAIRSAVSNLPFQGDQAQPNGAAGHHEALSLPKSGEGLRHIERGRECKFCIPCPFFLLTDCARCDTLSVDDISATVITLAEERRIPHGNDGADRGGLLHFAFAGYAAARLRHHAERRAFERRARAARRGHALRRARDADRARLDRVARRRERGGARKSIRSRPRARGCARGAAKTA